VGQVDRVKYPYLYELRKGEKCAACGGEIHPTSAGSFTLFALDTKTDKPYHGDCVPKDLA
jgi:hypothetical protein